jgi:aldehyde dehydrogenase (NAD+)
MPPPGPLDTLFPTQDQIPRDAWRAPDDAGLTLLIDGERRQWDGPKDEIRSAVCVRSADGRLERLALGPGAHASADLALEAVASASRAWAGGRGEWPRASSGARIACMLDFVRRARPLREPVARALMWEVGKPWRDCLKEFDRKRFALASTCLLANRLEPTLGG